MYVCSWAVSEIGPKLNILFIFFVGEIQVRLFDGISCSVGSNDMDICYYGTLSGVSLILPPPHFGVKFLPNPILSRSTGQEIGWEERLQNELFCVKWGVR